MLILAIVAAVAAATAYVTASTLYGGSLFDTVATACLVFAALLVGPMLGAGILGVMKPAVVAAACLALCGLLLAAQRKLPNLVARRPRSFHASPAELLLLAGLALAIESRLRFWSVLALDELLTGTSLDVILFELPTIVDFVQEKTLWTFDQAFPYYPWNYGLLLAWGIMFAKSYGANPLVQLFSLFGLLAYAAAITNLVLLHRPRAQRAIAALTVILLFLHMEVHMSTIYWVGKNDLFIAFCALASLFHLMRYWTAPEPRPDGHHVLAGIALGLMIGAKFSAAFWAVLMGLGHGVMLLRRAHGIGWRWLRTASRHLLFVGIPVLFFGGAWALRVSLGYEVSPGDGEFANLGWANTVLGLHQTRLVVDATPIWLPYWALAAGGGILAVAPVRWLPVAIRLAGLVAAGFAFHRLTTIPLYESTYLGTLAVSLTIGALPLLARLLSPDLVNGRLATVSGAATLSLLLFVVMPFSAWTGLHADLLDPASVTIAYRYTLSSFPLVLIALVGLGAELIGRYRPRYFLFEPRRLFTRDAGGRGLPLAGAALAGLVAAAPILARESGYERLDSTGPTWENFAAGFDEPTSIYSWARNNIRDSSLLIVNLPAAHFYGEEIGDNRVHGGRHRWADAYSFDRRAAEGLIEEEGIEHVVFGLSFHGSRLPAATLSHVESMRGQYSVLFEDEQAIVFATRHHRPRPHSPEIEYDFSTLAAENLRLLGFRRVERWQGLGFRWTNSTTSRVWARIEQDRDAIVSFQVEHAVDTATLESLRLFANDSEVELRKMQPNEGGHRFEARVPEALLRSGGPELELRFEVDEVADGLEAGVRGEPGDVGLLFNWLRIEPAGTAGS